MRLRRLLGDCQTGKVHAFIHLCDLPAVIDISIDAAPPHMRYIRIDLTWVSILVQRGRRVSQELVSGSLRCEIVSRPLKGRRRIRQLRCNCRSMPRADDNLRRRHPSDWNPEPAKGAVSHMLLLEWSGQDLYTRALRVPGSVESHWSALRKR